jgi:hypothetical protein
VNPRNRVCYAAIVILAELDRREILVELEGENNLRLSPSSALDDDLRARIREQKPEIRIAVLAAKSAEAQRKFGSSHARLFPLVGRRVHTPCGYGILQTVFSDRTEVALELDGGSKIAVFRPVDIAPAVLQ